MRGAGSLVYSSGTSHDGADENRGRGGHPVASPVVKVENWEGGGCAAAPRPVSVPDRSIQDSGGRAGPRPLAAAVLSCISGPSWHLTCRLCYF